MTITRNDIARLASEYATREPQDILRLALENFDDIAISFSGAEDVVLVDMASKLKANMRVFSLDTGRLHAETYRLLEQVRERYPIRFEVLFPDAAAVEKLVREKGLNSFYRDGHTECCGIRKVTPLRRILGTLDAWVTGQRRDQSPSTRHTIDVIEDDRAFGSATRMLVKFNPLANWSSAQVWRYIRDNDVPHNELHARGFASIGCEPCTRAVLPNQHEREGRWWWEEETKKECGLHVGNRIGLGAIADRLPAPSPLSASGPRHIIFVKKLKADGQTCRKCAQVEQRLIDSGQMNQIDEIVVADETDPQSPGMLLAARHGVKTAPFFIVRTADGTERIFTVYLKFVKDILGGSISSQDEARKLNDREPNLDTL